MVVYPGLIAPVDLRTFHPDLRGDAWIGPVANWQAQLNGLAGFTASATGGRPAKIQSAGFGVRAARTPTQALPAPEKVVARTNGKPGHTQLNWPPMPGAKSYMVQRCPDPISEDGWKLACSCTAASADLNGAEPGTRNWYRVAAVNGKGQGPWSEPTCRPVL